MVSSENLGKIQIGLGILIFIAAIIANVLFFNSPAMFEDRAPLVSEDELAYQSQEMIGEFTEEINRKGGMNATSFPVMHLSIYGGTLRTLMQLNAIAKVIVIGFDFIIFAQVVMLVLWGMQKFTTEPIRKKR